MGSVLAAEAAILVEFDTIRSVLLVLHRVVVALLAFGAGKRDLDSHFGTSIRFAALWRLSLPPSGPVRKKAHKKITRLKRY